MSSHAGTAPCEPGRRVGREPSGGRPAAYACGLTRPRPDLVTVPAWTLPPWNRLALGRPEGRRPRARADPARADGRRACRPPAGQRRGGDPASRVRLGAAHHAADRGPSALAGCGVAGRRRGDHRLLGRPLRARIRGTPRSPYCSGQPAHATGPPALAFAGMALALGVALAMQPARRGHRLDLDHHRAGAARRRGSAGENLRHRRQPLGGAAGAGPAARAANARSGPGRRWSRSGCASPASCTTSSRTR